MKSLKAKKALCVALAVSLTMPALQANAATDINGHWAQKTITQWQDKGLISGYEDGTFKPNKEVTRAEFVHILNTALKLTKQGEVKFTDVKQDNWFYKDIEIAVGEGYAKGTPENKFMPNATLTRAEAAVFIANIIKEKSDKELTFKDVENIPSWAKQAIALMVEKGYMAGYPDNTFSARKNLTRAEAVTILDKLMSQIQVSEKEDKKEEKKKTTKVEEEKKPVQAKKSSGGGGGGGGGGGSSSTPSIPKALGAKTVKNAQELEAAVRSGYNDITVEATEKIERDVNLEYKPKQELKITINKTQDNLDNIKITAPNAEKITLKDDGVQGDGTQLKTLTIDAPKAHVESSLAVDTVEIIRVASSTFKALDVVTTIKVQNKAKIEVTDTASVPNVEVQTSEEVKLEGKYNTVTTTKDSNIKLEKETKIKEYAPSATASQSMITGGEIEKITAQSNLTIKDTKVQDIVIPITTDKKLTIEVQGTAEVERIVNHSINKLKLIEEKKGQVKDTSKANLEIEEEKKPDKKEISEVKIIGEAKLGDILSADVKPDGAKVTYKWEVSEKETEAFQTIVGAKEKTYKITEKEEGKYLRVIVSGDESQGYTGEKTSKAVKVADKVVPPAPKTTEVTEVVVENKQAGKDIKLGSTLIAKTTPKDAKVRYRWQFSATDVDKDFVDIAKKADKEEYTITEKEEGKYLRVVVSGDKSQGYTGEKTSKSVKVADKVVKPPKTLPKIAVKSVNINDYDIKVGTKLTAEVRPSNATVTYQWMVADTADGKYDSIPYSSTDKNYTITEKEAGKFIKVVVKGTGEYEEGEVWSNFVSVQNISNAKKVSINGADGEGEVGEVLTAKVEPDNAEVSYQWKRQIITDGPYEDIAGAVEKTYMVQNKERYLKVEVRDKYSQNAPIESEYFPIYKRDNVLDVKLRPSEENFKTNVRVTTEPLLSDEIIYKYEISNEVKTYHENLYTPKNYVDNLKDLDKDLIRSSRGQDIELDENQISNIEGGVVKYLVVCKFKKVDDSNYQVLEYANISIAKDKIRLPEKKEWEIKTSHILEDDKIFIKGRFETAENFINNLEILSEGKDIKDDFDIELLLSNGRPLYLQNYIFQECYAYFVPKTREGRYIYGTKRFDFNIIDVIEDLRFKEGKVVQVGDPLTAEVFIKVPNRGNVRLEELFYTESYENLIFRWYREENGIEEEISGATQRRYVIKDKDVGKTIRVKVRGDGESVSSDVRSSERTNTIKEKILDVSIDGKPYEEDTTKIKIKIFDKDISAIDDSMVKVEEYIYGEPKNIKDEFKVISAEDKEYEVTLKDVDKIYGNKIRLSIAGTRYNDAEIYIHRSLEGIEFFMYDMSGTKKLAEIKGSNLLIKGSDITIENLLHHGYHVNLEVYDIAGKLMTENRFGETFKNGMKLKVSSKEMYPNGEYKEYAVVVEE